MVCYFIFLDFTYWLISHNFWSSAQSDCACLIFVVSPLGGVRVLTQDVDPMAQRSHSVSLHGDTECGDVAPDDAEMAVLCSLAEHAQQLAADDAVECGDYHHGHRERQDGVHLQPWKQAGESQEHSNAHNCKVWEKITNFFRSLWESHLQGKLNLFNLWE